MRRYLTFLNRLAMSFALCLLLAPELLLAQGRTYVPVVGTTGLTSSSTSITSSVPILLPDGSAAAPAIAFSAVPTHGFYRYGSGVTALTNGTTINQLFNSEIFTLRNSGSVQWSSTVSAAGATDVALYRDAANTLALRRGTNAQAFNVYNTYTDASNYERLSLYWAGNKAYVDVPYAGTGAARELRIGGQAGSIILGAATYPNASDARPLGAASFLWSNIYVTRSTQGSKSKALTDNVATAFVQIAIPQTAEANYADGEISFTIFCRDASNQTVQRGSLEFACHNIAGAEACTFAPSGTIAGAVQGDGTASLGPAVFTATGGADAVVFSVQSNCTGVVPTTQTIQYRLNMMQPNTVTPQ